MFKSALARLSTSSSMSAVGSKRKSSSFSNADSATKESKVLEAKRKDVAQIASRMKHQYAEERTRALMSILKKDVVVHFKEQILDLLARGLEDSDAHVRYTAVKVLEEVAARTFDNSLESSCCGPCGLESPDLDARVAAARAMGRVVCPSDVKVITMIAKRLAVSESPKVQEAASEALCEVGVQIYEKAMQIISRGFEHPDAAVRKDAVNFVADIGAGSDWKHADIISCGLKDPDASVRLAAQNAKKKVECREWETTVLELFVAHVLEKSDAGVRQAATSAVRSLANIEEEDHSGTISVSLACQHMSPGSRFGRHSNASQSACHGGA